MKKFFLYSTILLITGGISDYALSSEEVRALVQTQPLVQHVLAETVSGYGSVSVDPLSTESINFPRAGRVTRLLVSQGEVVKKDAPLLQLETAPQESVAYEQARSAADLAKNELLTEQGLLASQLATRSQVATAQKNLLDAEASLAAQQKIGTGTPSETVKAPFDGIVSAVQIAQGDRIQLGATALKMSRLDRLRVVLGIEPDEARRVRRGMSVQLISVFEPTQSASGVVSIVNGMIDPRTGLVDVIVTPKPGRTLRLIPGIRIQGVIKLASHREFAVPRQAVLSDGQGPYLFVIRNGHAHRINVQTDVTGSGLIGVIGQFEKEERVVVLGNYEIRDGMSVREASR